MTAADTVTTARNAAFAASLELQAIQREIAFALANPAEVTRAELADLKARAAAAADRMNALVDAFDAARRAR
jgi:hypothetical protein